ncbi:MAG: hypothetical protein M3Q05_02530, partial [Bacteroidota bacterium]|nr:hypothetical protein [Bacteroidota bacterium]
IQNNFNHHFKPITMRKFRILILIVATITVSSCSRNIHLNYQLDPANTGKIIIKSSKPTEKTMVTLNDYLIVKKKKVKSVTIHNVPNGSYTMHYVSGNKWYKEKLDAQIPIVIENGKEVTKLVEVPAYKKGYWYYMAGQAVLSGAIGVLLK